MSHEHSSRGIGDKIKAALHNEDSGSDNEKDSKLKTAAKVGAGILAAGGAAYGAKKLYEHHQEKDEQENLMGSQGSTKKKDDEGSDEDSKLKTAAKVGAGVLAAGGVAYGAKKLYDHHKDDDEEDESSKLSSGSGGAMGYGSVDSKTSSTGMANVKKTEGEEDDDEKDHSKLKMAAGIGAGLLAAGGVAYGAKKLYDHHQEKDEQENLKLQGAGSASMTSTTTTSTSSYTTGTAAKVQGGSGEGVAYGGTLALKHNMSGRFLDQSAYTPKSTQSNQSLAVCGEWNVNQNSTWCVEGGSGTVQYGGEIRLRHVATGRYLHSHQGPTAPVTTSHQEVTAYESDDDNNVWIVEPWGDEVTTGNWRWTSGVKLRHRATGVRLYSHDVQVSGGGVEVTGFHGDFEEGLRWRAQQA